MTSLKSALLLSVHVRCVVSIQVHALSLVLNKKTNELAKASVSKLSTHVEMIGESEPCPALHITTLLLIGCHDPQYLSFNPNPNMCIYA